MVGLDLLNSFYRSRSQIVLHGFDSEIMRLTTSNQCGLFSSLNGSHVFPHFQSDVKQPLIHFVMDKNHGGSFSMI